MPAGVTLALRRTLLAGFPILISALLLVWIGQSMDWRAVLSDAMRAPLWALGVGIAIVFAQLSLCGVRLHSLSASIEAPVSRGAATAIWGVSYLAGLTLPSSVGSELVKGGLLLRWMRFPGRILGVIALEKLLALAAMAIVVLTAAPLLAVAAHRTEAPIIASLALAGLAVIGCAFLLRTTLLGWACAALSRIGVPRPAAESLERTLNAAPLGTMTLLSIAIHLLTLVMIGVLAAGLGVANAWQLALLGGPIVVLASILPISVGGLGVREGAAILVFGALGTSSSEAASIGLALWGSQLLAAALASAAAIVWMLLQRNASALRASAQSPTADPVSASR